MNPEKATLSITGMHCAACAARIEKVVQRQPGVVDVHVNLAMERATVVFESDQTGVSDIITRVERLGYGASVITIRLAYHRWKGLCRLLKCFCFRRALTIPFVL